MYYKKDEDLVISQMRDESSDYHTRTAAMLLLLSREGLLKVIILERFYNMSIADLMTLVQIEDK